MARLMDRSFLGQKDVVMKSAEGNISEFLQFLDTNGLAFRREIMMAAFRELGFNNNKGAIDSTEMDLIYTKIHLAIMEVMRLKNEQYSNFLNWGINPGVAIMWIKTQCCESESLIVSRPAGFINISSNPVLKKTQADKSDSNHVQFNF